MTEVQWRMMLSREGVQVRGGLCALWKRLCSKIRRSIRENIECLGFDVIRSGKGEYRIVDGTTQVPMTKWHVRYDKALEELKSCVL